MKQDEWFAALQVEKQSLLAKYAQSRMFQEEALSSLRETHTVNQDLFAKTVIGNIANTLEAMFFDNHKNELDFVWERFRRVQKDTNGRLTPGISLQNFVTASQKIKPAMYGIIEMLTAQSFNSERLWSTEGFCDGSALNYFQGFLLLSLYLKSVASRAQGLQINAGQLKEFSDGIQGVKLKHDSSCSCKLLITTYYRPLSSAYFNLYQLLNLNSSFTNL